VLPPTHTAKRNILHLTKKEHTWFPENMFPKDAAYVPKEIAKPEPLQAKLTYTKMFTDQASSDRSIEAPYEEYCLAFISISLRSHLD